MTDKIIAIIPKNANEEIRVGTTVFNGHQLAYCRVFYDAGGGDMRPGKSGINVRVEQLGDIVAAFEKIIEGGGT